MTKLGYISPGSIYEYLDEGSRELLLWVANDLNYGMGIGIVGVSLALKVVFAPIMVKAQLNAIRMKLIEPEMKNFQQATQRLSRMGDFTALRDAQKQFAKLRQKYGIHNWVIGLSLTQIPFLITWFLSLRYVSQLPDKYPGLRTDGFLWFQDLSEMDPYFVLPVLNATISYFNISLNPNLSNQSTATVFSKYMKYMKFLPFLSLPIVGFFPSALNLYWCMTAATHLSIAVFVRSSLARKIFGIP